MVAGDRVWFTNTLVKTPARSSNNTMSPDKKLLCAPVTGFRQFAVPPLSQTPLVVAAHVRFVAVLRRKRNSFAWATPRLTFIEPLLIVDVLLSHKFTAR